MVKKKLSQRVLFFSIDQFEPFRNVNARTDKVCPGCNRHISLPGCALDGFTTSKNGEKKTKSKSLFFLIDEFETFKTAKARR